MTPRYVIHIGPMKTASTYLQQSLTAAQADLAKLGVCYPQEFIAESNKFMHMPIYYSLLRGRAEDMRPTFAKLNAEGHKTIVLSCEHFIFLKPEAMAALRDVTGASEFQVVYAARRWSDRVGSLWNQALFMGSADSLPEFYLALLAGKPPSYYPKWMVEDGAAADLDYSLSWRHVESVFGRDSLAIFPYSTIMDRKQDVFEAFCKDILGLAEAPVTAVTGQRRWASMSMEDQEVLRVLNDLHLRAGGAEDGSVRAQFMRRRKQYDTSPIATAMQDDMASLLIDDRNVQFNAPYEAMQKYADRVTGGDVLFERSEKSAKYARPGYLLKDGVRECYLATHAQITADLAAAAAAKPAPAGKRKQA